MAKDDDGLEDRMRALLGPPDLVDLVIYGSACFAVGGLVALGLHLVGA